MRILLVRMLFVTAVYVIWVPATLYGQANAKAGTFEIYGYGGGTFDLPSARAVVGLVNVDPLGHFFNPVTSDSGQRSMQGTFGGGLALSLSRYFWAYGDYTYIIKDKREARISRDSAQALATADTHYSSAQFGLQFSYPTVYRVAPYLLIGGGFLHNSRSRTSISQGVTTPGVSHTFTSENIGLIHYGGGVRFFLGDRWGIRGGVDGFYLVGGTVTQSIPVITTDAFIPAVSRHGFGRVSGGLFYQFGR